MLKLGFGNSAYCLVGDTDRGTEELNVNACPNRANGFSVGNFVHAIKVILVYTGIHSRCKDHIKRAAEAHHRKLLGGHDLNQAVEAFEDHILKNDFIQKPLANCATCAKGVLFQHSVGNFVKHLSAIVGDVGLLGSGVDINGGLILFLGDKYTAVAIVIAGVVNGLVNVVESAEVLPKNFGVIPIGGVTAIIGIFDFCKSVKPSVARFSLHRHGEGRENRRNNVLVSVEQQLDIKRIIGVAVKKVIGKILIVCFVYGKRRECTVSCQGTVGALLVIFGKHFYRDLNVICHFFDVVLNVLYLLLVIGKNKTAVHIHHFDVGNCFGGVGGCGISKVYLIVGIGSLVQVVIQQLIALGNLCFGFTFALGINELNVL